MFCFDCSLKKVVVLSIGNSMMAVTCFTLDPVRNQSKKSLFVCANLISDRPGLTKGSICDTSNRISYGYKQCGVR